jgi:hypothetical protein
MQNLRVARDTPTKTVPGNTCDAPAADADKRPNFEGTAFDPLVYDQSLGVTNGAAGKVSGCSFSRVAGIAHCRGAPRLDHFVMLSAVVNWVEQGTAPAR